MEELAVVPRARSRSAFAAGGGRLPIRCARAERDAGRKGCAGEAVEELISGKGPWPRASPRSELLCRYGALAAATAALIVLSVPACAETTRVAYVIDGDTFRLETGERIRIAGIDAPETQAGQAKCRAEITRGQAATRDARALLEGRAITIERVGRSYNRTVANVRLKGRDVAAMLVTRGIAAWWPRGRPRPNWCGR